MRAISWIARVLIVVRPRRAISRPGFETEWLATDDNVAALTALSGFWIDRVHDRRPPKIDRARYGRSGDHPDSTAEQTVVVIRSTTVSSKMCLRSSFALWAQPVRSIWNGCALRPGNLHLHPDWLRTRWSRAGRQQIPRPEALLGETVVSRMPPIASPEVYEFLEAEGFLHANTTFAAFAAMLATEHRSFTADGRLVSGPPR